MLYVFMASYPLTTPSSKLPKSGWIIYDTNNIKVSEWENVSNEDFCVSVITDEKKVGGFTWNKLIKRQVALSVYFDEDTRLMQDELWIMHLLFENKNMCIFRTNYVLYCYVNHKNVGQTRNYKRIYNEEGLSRFIVCIERELAIKTLSASLKEDLNAKLYFFAVTNLYQMGRRMTKDTRQKVKKYISKYAGIYYFRSKRPLIQKIKTLIKHILVSLHVYKY